MPSFREQTQVLNSWFSQWNRCEQTISLYALLSRVSAEQARFLMLVLEHNLKARSETDKQDLEGVAEQANSADYVHRLGQESHDLVASRLLSFLLLLQPGNSNATLAYLKLLPSVLLQSAFSDDGQLDDSRQLLSLALVHPAFPSQEKTKLRCLLAMLEEKANHFEQSHPTKWPMEQQAKRVGGYDGDCSILNRPASPVGSRPSAWKPAVQSHLPPGKDKMAGIPTSVSIPNGHPQFLSHNILSVGGKPERTRSLRYDGVGGMSLLVSSTDDDGASAKERSRSLPQPTHSSQSSGGDQSMKNGVWCSERPKITDGFSKPGMKDVPQWLKSLRLHKYQDLFAYMTYDDMMRVTEEELEGKNVTKGARHKIVSSIQKLKDRFKQLETLEEDIGQPGKQMHQIVQELKAIVLTPIRPSTAKSSLRDPTVSRPSPQRSGEKEDASSESQSSESTKGIGGGENGELDADYTKQRDKVDEPCLVRKNSLDVKLSAKFICVVDKVFNHLLRNGTDDDTLSVFATVLDMTLKKEAFTVEQRKQVFAWRQHCQQEPRRAQRRSTELKSGLRFGNPALNAGHGNGYPGVSVIGSHSLHSLSQQKSASLPGANRTRRPPRGSGNTLPGGSASGMCGKPFGVLSLGQPGLLGYGSGMGARLTTQMRLAPSRPQMEEQSEQVRAQSVPASDTGSDCPEKCTSDGSNDHDHYMEALCIQVTEHALSDVAEGNAGY